MVYNALEQHDRDHDDEDSDADIDSSRSGLRVQRRRAAAPVFAPLSLFTDDDHNTSHSQNKHQNNKSESQSESQSQSQQRNLSPSSNSGGLAHMVHSITSRNTKTSGSGSGSYEMVENDDFADDAPSDSYSIIDNLQQGPGARSRLRPHPRSPSEQSSTSPVVPLHIPRPIPRNHRSPATTAEKSASPSSPPLHIPHPIRTASKPNTALRHPTPDLQVLQGAYTGNIEHLERTAERLSMTSSIDDAIRDLHDEQKRSDGIAAISRQVSNAASIVEVNSAARSGGYSPAAFMMSPKGSFSAGGRNRSASKSSKFTARSEPEFEGRPLDSFVNLPSIPSTSPIMSRSASIAEQDDQGSATMTRPVVDSIEPSKVKEHIEERPTTSASTNTFDQEQKMFADFDGVHDFELENNEPPQVPEHQERRLSGNALENPQRRISFGNDLEHPQRSMSPGNGLDSPDKSQRRMSAGNRLSMLSMPRPQSYADPDSGQQMVYYPAPVPMMLNLPQRLSKGPPANAMNKRRSQVMSNIPQAVRQSAIWLPDVLEDEPDFAEEGGIHEQEYMPQHQRTVMGGRRSTHDLANLPPQLRASTFFDLPAPEQTVEMKGQSAVATLDSILDASAHAPVSAFTDHAFAGHLGSEVYGKSTARHSRSSTQLLEIPEKQKKRTSSFNLLRGRRASSNDLLEDKKRASTMSGGLDSGKMESAIDDEDESKEASPLNQSETDLQSRVVSGDFGPKGEAGEEESEDEGQRDDEEYHGPPTTLLAELQLRKQQQKQRTKLLASAYPNGMHSTLLQLDAVAQVEQKSRKQKRVNLAWEDPAAQGPADDNDDDDVPLAMLYSKKAADLNRPLGLMERRDMEDNEPLSRRRDRLQGRPPGSGRATTMMNHPADPEEEGETLGQRLRRLKEQGGTVTGLPALARPVSGDFASEMMSQFGGDMLDGKGKGKE
ncbi:hypothetical protein LSUE1_G008488, partial [Lachnellula suecica]